MKLLIEYQYFSPVILFKILYNLKHITFERYETYQKASFRNRMMIASPYGPVALSIPVAGGRNTRLPVHEVEIDNREPWRDHHLKTLKNYYNRSPWFDHFLPELEEMYHSEPPRLLVNWNRNCFEWVCRQLAIPAIIAETSSYSKTADEKEYLDMRGVLRPSGNRETNGKMLPEPPVYRQVFQEKTGFLPNLSVLDLLFCEGPRAIDCLTADNPQG